MVSVHSIRVPIKKYVYTLQSKVSHYGRFNSQMGAVQRSIISKFSCCLIEDRFAQSTSSMFDVLRHLEWLVQDDETSMHVHKVDSDYIQNKHCLQAEEKPLSEKRHSQGVNVYLPATFLRKIGPIQLQLSRKIKLKGKDHTMSFILLDLFPPSPY